MFRGLGRTCWGENLARAASFRSKPLPAELSGDPLSVFAVWNADGWSISRQDHNYFAIQGFNLVTSTRLSC